jgi:hypothetical protein
MEPGGVAHFRQVPANPISAAFKRLVEVDFPIARVSEHQARRNPSERPSSNPCGDHELTAQPADLVVSFGDVADLAIAVGL